MVLPLIDCDYILLIGHSGEKIGVSEAWVRKFSILSDRFRKRRRECDHRHTKEIPLPELQYFTSAHEECILSHQQYYTDDPYLFRVYGSSSSVRGGGKEPQHPWETALERLWINAQVFHFACTFGIAFLRQAALERCDRAVAPAWHHPQLAELVVYTHGMRDKTFYALVALRIHEALRYVQAPGRALRSAEWREIRERLRAEAGRRTAQGGRYGREDAAALRKFELGVESPAGVGPIFDLPEFDQGFW